MPYHVRVYVVRAVDPEVELDLEREALEERFVGPFRRRQPIIVNGRLVDAEHIKRIRISYSDDPSSDILQRIELENIDRGFPVRDRARLAAQVAGRAQDVTLEFIPDAPAAGDRRTVLLVRGRWHTAAKAMEEFMRAMDLEVINWDKARLGGQEGQHNTDILDQAFAMAYAVVVFMTPEDLAILHPDIGADILAGQPRPNVLFEAGYAWHAMRDRTLLVRFGEIRKLSNLSGVDPMRFDGSKDARTQLADRLRRMKVAVKTEGSEFLTAGDFPPPLDEVVPSDLGWSPAAALLRGIPLHWVLLAKLDGESTVDIPTVAAHTTASLQEVTEALAWLMRQGLAEPMKRHTRDQALANGSCVITIDGRKRLEAETRLSQS